MTKCTVWLQQVILHTTNTHKFIHTHEFNFDVLSEPITSFSLVNVLLLSIRFSFICEGQLCRVYLM